MTGRCAIIVGASGGIGQAVANALDQRPDFDAVYRIGRSGTPVIDLLDESSISAASQYFAAQSFAPDLIFVATGILHQGDDGPEKTHRELDPEWMMLNYRLNAIGPALVAKHFLPLMPKDKPTCFAALSARVGSISDNKLGGWHSYRASKAALNMLIRNLSIEWQRKNPQSVIVGLHPGTVETPLSAPFKGNPAHKRFTPELAAAQLLTVLDGLQPHQSGQLLGYDGKVIAP